MIQYFKIHRSSHKVTLLLLACEFPHYLIVNRGGSYDCGERMIISLGLLLKFHAFVVFFSMFDVLMCDTSISYGYDSKRGYNISERKIGCRMVYFASKNVSDKNHCFGLKNSTPLRQS